MRELLAYLLKEITGREDIGIQEEAANDRVNFVINAPNELLGMIIGKSGRTIKTIRNLVRVRATLEKKGVSITIAENLT